MIKKISMVIIILVMLTPSITQHSIAETTAGEIGEGEETIFYRNTTVWAPAVAKTDEGYFGVISTITVTIQNNGSGRVFVDTLPLTQVDMQGSARLAVKVASALVINDINCDVDPSTFDYFFVVRTDAPIIGGPSAGAIMTVATISLLENWTIDSETVMTGMINPDGSIGPIGGIPQKIDAAWNIGAKRFLIPKGQGTYTELVTTTEGIFTRTRPVVKKVEDYIIENGYDIEVIEVADINEAVVNFTGHTFIFEGPEDGITTENYNTSMKPLASNLLEEASNSYDIAKNLFAVSEIPNTGGFYDNYRNYVADKLQSAQDTLTESESWFNQSQYYTSTSKSFQSLIHSRFVRYACEYYESSVDERDIYIENLLDDVQDIYDNATDLVKNNSINGFITLQSVGAAQRRISEAGNAFEAEKEDYDDGKVTSSFWQILYFLENIAFVVERSTSVSWWIDIGTKFKDIGDLDDEAVDNLALEYIGEAQQASVYSSIILEEIGSSYSDSLSYLSNAETLIETARDDHDRGYYAAALFEALEALVKAHLAIEIIGTNAEDKINLARETASNNIAKSRKEGIEPILAVSYFEFAESLNNESSYDSALIYYKYSGLIAGALSFTNVTTGSASSKYVGVPDYNPPGRGAGFFLDAVFLIILLILAGFAGFGFGLVVAGISLEHEKKPDRSKHHPGYARSHKTTHHKRYRYPDNQIPKSIKDYYKKNK